MNSKLTLFCLMVLAITGCSAGHRKQVINPATAQRLAPYSTAVRSGKLVFLSGTIGRRADGTLPAGTEAQTAQALDNLRNNLAAAGLAPIDVVKCTVFLIDMQDYEVMNRVYGQFFTEAPPARSAVAVAALPAGARVEIECIAAAR